jgi:hypothetical protein
MSSPVAAITILTLLCNRLVLLRFNRKRMCLLLRPNITLNRMSLVFSDMCLLSLLSAMNSLNHKKPKKASLKTALILTLLTCVKKA